MIQKLIINSVIKLIAKQFKLDEVLDYVENENDLDRKVKILAKKLKKLEKEAIKWKIK
jgi:hypothetical protein